MPRPIDALLGRRAVECELLTPLQVQAALRLQEAETPPAPPACARESTRATHWTFAVIRSLTFRNRLAKGPSRNNSVNRPCAPPQDCS